MKHLTLYTGEQLNVQQYTATVKHDTGTIKITTAASSPEAARKKIRNFENCPDSAILTIEPATNKKPITIDRQYQPKTGQKCSCKRGQQRDNCPACEGTGWIIDFQAIRAHNQTPTT